MERIRHDCTIFALSRCPWGLSGVCPDVRHHHWNRVRHLRWGPAGRRVGAPQYRHRPHARGDLNRATAGSCSPAFRRASTSCAPSSRDSAPWSVDSSPFRWRKTLSLPLVMEVGGLEQAVTVSGGASSVNTAHLGTELPRRRAGDRDAAAERPQLHRPRAAAAGRAAVSVARRRVGRRARSRHEHQRAGLSVERLPAGRHAPERLHQRAGRQRRRHDARHGRDPRVPRRVQRLQRGVRPQLRRADQRPDQVGHEHAARQRVRVPPQRRARRAQLLRRRRQARLHAQPVRRLARRPAAGRSPVLLRRLRRAARAPRQDHHQLRPRRRRAPRHPARRPGDDQRRDPAVPRRRFPSRPGRRSAAAWRRTRSGSTRSSIRRSCRAASTTRPGAAHQFFARHTYDDGEQRLPTDYPRSRARSSRPTSSSPPSTGTSDRSGRCRRRGSATAARASDRTSRPTWRRRCRRSSPAAALSATSTSAACSGSVRRPRPTCAWRRTSTAASTT